jgi:hypothetical protein
MKNKDQIQQQIARLQKKMERVSALPDSEAKSASLSRTKTSLSMLQSQSREAPKTEAKP